MLNIIGGTYIERCREPSRREIFGSGFRAAIALADKAIDIKFSSCVGEKDIETVTSICNTYEIVNNFKLLDKTIIFYYDHPLVKPKILDKSNDIIDLVVEHSSDDNILYYGMIEATSTVNGNYVVYDPQNWVSFKNTKSTANHLAIILNKQEAQNLYGNENEKDLSLIGERILALENAEVVVIKDGTCGAFVIEKGGAQRVPVFETEKVWPIGSGDVFSAVFAWKWIECGLPASQAAYYASSYTAFYCETCDLPLPEDVPNYKPIPEHSNGRKIYLAGPFFTMGERWLINEFRNTLRHFGNIVFSPYHDVGVRLDQDVVDKDITAIFNSDLLLAIANGLDAGTLFEIGYARAKGKRVVVFAENVSEEDLLMLKGTECEITNDFSTAVYIASW
jgi:nucleoside 2-deoxyribosyltransferase